MSDFPSRMATYVDCGCVIDRLGDEFIIKPCSLTCPVYIEALRASGKQGNRVEFRGEQT